MEVWVQSPAFRLHAKAWTLNNAGAALASVMAGLLIVCAACQRGPSNAPRTYTAKGRVVSVAPDRQSVAIQHEDIEGFMPAMTMSFPVKDPALLNGLAPNDLVRFELTVTDQDSWISRIEKTGHQEKLEDRGSRIEDHDDQAPSSILHPPSSILTPGQAVPPFTLTDQDGRRVSLEEFRGKPVAITFIFTRCPLPEYCPRFTNNFAAVQNQLTSRFKNRFHLLSITIDPAHDTPKVLKEYGQRSDADFHTWSFLTGSKEDIRKVAGYYGVSFWDEEGTISHTAACAVVTSTGRLYKFYRGNTWTPEQIISDLTTLLMEPSPRQLGGLKS